MAARKLHWSPKFLKKYQTLEGEAFANLDAGRDRPMRHFLRVGETLQALANASGLPENDRLLDTRPFVELSGLARSEKTVQGSRIREEPADYRIFWRQSHVDVRGLELVDLVWPCL